MIKRYNGGCTGKDLEKMKKRADREKKKIKILRWIWRKTGICLKHQYYHYPLDGIKYIKYCTVCESKKLLNEVIDFWETNLSKNIPPQEEIRDERLLMSRSGYLMHKIDTLYIGSISPAGYSVEELPDEVRWLLMGNRRVNEILNNI
jgi:hypothetical protein